MDYKSFAEVDRLTIPEYELLMQAVRLKQVDMDYRNHLQAFLNFAVNGEGVRGDVTVSADQQEVAEYVFTDTTKSGA